MMREGLPSANAAVISLMPHGGWSLEQAREWLRRKVEDQGAPCPCCNQFAKVYRRKMYATMARTLIYARQRYNTEYFHLSTLDGQQVGVRQADFPKLAYWKLIEKHPSKPHWRLTSRGLLFVGNQMQVPETVVLYDSNFMRFEGPEVSIVKVLGNKFSYKELMSA